MLIYDFLDLFAEESAEKEPAWGPVRKIASSTLMVWRIKVTFDVFTSDYF